MRPTIYTVAEKAGVSIATVSRVLNESPNVRETTRRKVRRAIDELGYQPSASARGLASSTTRTLALIFPRLSGPFFSELIRGAEAEAYRYHYHLLIYGSRDDDEDEELLQTLATKADGLILAGACACRSFVEGMAEAGLPIVLLGRKAEGFALDSIRPDNAGGAERAVAHLAEHGYERIGLIGGPPGQTHADDREAGYRSALLSHGLPWDPEMIVRGNYEETSGYEAMLALLALSSRPRAVFAANDQMAIGALAAARVFGLRVPEDVALVGFDDIEAARYLLPALTTVRQDIYEQGELAVQLLLSRMADPETPARTRLIPTPLVIRRSCGCKLDLA